MIKANFKIIKNLINEPIDKNVNTESDLTQQEFEEFVMKSGAKGSFMVYRSNKKDDELGLDAL